MKEERKYASMRGSMERQFRIFVTLFVVGGSALFLSFITTYTFIFFLGKQTQLLEQIMKDHFLAMVGIPLSALSATVMVALFRVAAGDLEFEGLGFRFRGASGPAIIWILTFIVYIGSLKLLWGCGS